MISTFDTIIPSTSSAAPSSEFQPTYKVSNNNPSTSSNSTVRQSTSNSTTSNNPNLTTGAGPTNPIYSNNSNTNNIPSTSGVGGGASPMSGASGAFVNQPSYSNSSYSGVSNTVSTPINNTSSTQNQQDALPPSQYQSSSTRPSVSTYSNSSAAPNNTNTFNMAVMGVNSSYNNNFPSNPVSSPYVVGQQNLSNNEFTYIQGE
jgi:hypothetical protein